MLRCAHEPHIQAKNLAHDHLLVGGRETVSRRTVEDRRPGSIVFLPTDGQLDSLQNPKKVRGSCARLIARKSTRLGWFNTAERGILNGRRVEQSINGLNASHQRHAQLLFMTTSPSDRSRSRDKVH
jgi:hypothetical protein